MPNYSKSEGDSYWFLIAWCVICIVVAVGFLSLGIHPYSSLTCDSIPPNHYWSGQDAPDGEYEVHFSSVDIEQRIDYESNIVDFPLCPTAPNELHGEWSFADGVVFPSEPGWIVVVLENNLIVEVKLDA